MIEANNPDIDYGALERRIAVEMLQPEQHGVPALTAGGQLASGYKTSALLALKMRLRGIPVIGSAMAMLNQWQRQRQIGARLLAVPYLGYGLRWLKSLALVHETRGRLEMTVRELGAAEHRFNARLGEANARLGEVNARLDELRQEMSFVEQRLKVAQELNLAHTTALRQEVDEEKRRSAENRSEMVFQQRRLTAALAAPALQSGAGAAAVGVTMPARTDALDSYYAAFEAAFRGSREQIKSRLEVYMDRMSVAATHLPVLDIGCGRGEWIELLAESGIKAYGIDLNSVFVADARTANLDVREAEALAHLQSLPDASLAGLTGFHIIEHLALDDLIRIIDEANRVLTPGGFILFETPNPENLIVGASTFWNDPTHRAPLPPSVSRFMVEQRGFLNAEVIYLHEADEAQKLQGDDAVAMRLNRLLYGPMDYAIWARKA